MSLFSVRHVCGTDFLYIYLCRIIVTLCYIIYKADEIIKAVEEIYPEIEPQGIKVYVIGASKGSGREPFYHIDDILDQALDKRPDRKCRAGITLNSTLCYIYTSGTTGNYIMDFIELCKYWNSLKVLS